MGLCGAAGASAVAVPSAAVDLVVATVVAAVTVAVTAIIIPVSIYGRQWYKDRQMHQSRGSGGTFWRREGRVRERGRW